jgi:hypothetical protein
MEVRAVMSGIGLAIQPNAVARPSPGVQLNLSQSTAPAIEGLDKHQLVDTLDRATECGHEALLLLDSLHHRAVTPAWLYHV